MRKWFNTEPQHWKHPDVPIEKFRPFETFESPACPDDYFQPTRIMEDCFVFDGCYSLNPYTGKSTGQLMIFMEWPLGSGLFPVPIVSGPYRNVTEMPDESKRENLKIAQATADWMVATNR